MTRRGITPEAENELKRKLRDSNKAGYSSFKWFFMTGLVVRLSLLVNQDVKTVACLYDSFYDSTECSDRRRKDENISETFFMIVN